MSYRRPALIIKYRPRTNFPWWAEEESTGKIYALAWSRHGLRFAIWNETRRRTRRHRRQDKALVWAARQTDRLGDRP